MSGHLLSPPLSYLFILDFGCAGDQFKALSLLDLPLLMSYFLQTYSFVLFLIIFIYVCILWPILKFVLTKLTTKKLKFSFENRNVSLWKLCIIIYPNIFLLLDRLFQNFFTYCYRLYCYEHSLNFTYCYRFTLRWTSLVCCCFWKASLSVAQASLEF